ncbi:DUF2651 family protein [Fictibacillus sp. Mic-4]|uniref:DUF2651 family protein n=1 Tax=Fictibacillus sp. Mic-4 TaxID=3132826 RepID=UPI003CF2CB22
MTHLELAFGFVPVSVIILSFILTLFVKKIYVMPLISFIACIILMFTVFNQSFFGWALVYTVFSLIFSYLAILIVKLRKKSK